MTRDLAGIALFALAVAALAQVLESGVWLNFVMTALYGALLAQAWNLLGGYGGQFSFGHALFFGVGAYVQVIAQVTYGVNAWVIDKSDPGNEGVCDRGVVIVPETGRQTEFAGNVELDLDVKGK